MASPSKSFFPGHWEGRRSLFEDQIVTTEISEGGDSGALVLDEKHRAVGLLFGGGHQVSVRNLFGEVLSAMGVTLYESGVPAQGRRPCSQNTDYSLAAEIVLCQTLSWPASSPSIWGGPRLPYNLGEWPRGVKEWSIYLIVGGFFLSLLMSGPFFFIGFIVGVALVGAGIVVGLFGISRWIFWKLRVRLAVERLPKLPKQP